jgi:ATP-dependent Clp protease ATP-binding subunit ClpC
MRQLKESVDAALKRTFRPEFLNRIDGTVVFHALSKDHILEIVELMLKDVHDQLLKDKNVEMEVTQVAKSLLAEKGYDPNFGARPLRRVIQDEIEDRLSEELLTSHMQAGDTVVIDVEEDQFVIHTKTKVALPAG